MGLCGSHTVLLRERFEWQFNDTERWHLQPIAIRESEPGYSENVRVLETWHGTLQGRSVAFDVTDFMFPLAHPNHIWEPMANRRPSSIESHRIPLLTIRDSQGIIGVVHVDHLSRDYWVLERISTVGASHNLLTFGQDKQSHPPVLDKPATLVEYRLDRERFRIEPYDALTYLYHHAFGKLWPLVTLLSREQKWQPTWARRNNEK